MKHIKIYRFIIKFNPVSYNGRKINASFIDRYKQTRGKEGMTTRRQHMRSKSKKVKQSLYTPWRRLGGEEV
jgi:hypothetical protein